MGDKHDLNLNPTSCSRRQTNVCSPHFLCVCVSVSVQKRDTPYPRKKTKKFCSLLWLLFSGAKHFLALSGICKWLNQLNMQQWKSCLLQPSPITTAKQWNRTYFIKAQTARAWSNCSSLFSEIILAERKWTSKKSQLCPLTTRTCTNEMVCLGETEILPFEF